MKGLALRIQDETELTTLILVFPAFLIISGLREWMFLYPAEVVGVHADAFSPQSADCAIKITASCERRRR